MLKALAGIAALFMAVIAAYTVYYVYANGRAETAADQFCNTVIVGAAVSGIKVRAEAAGARYLSSSTSNTAKVYFQGAVFNGFYCDLTVAEGKVVSRRVTKVED